MTSISSIDLMRHGSVSLMSNAVNLFDYPSGFPKFRDIGTDKLYSEETFRTIWDRFKRGKEEEIIELLKSDPILRDRKFMLIMSDKRNLFSNDFQDVRATTFLSLACYFCATKVVTFIIKNSDFWHKGPKDLVKFISQQSNPPSNTLSLEPQYRIISQDNSQNYDMASPLDELVELNSKPASELFDLVLNSGRVPFYTITKNGVLTSKEILGLQYVMNPEIAEVVSEIETEFKSNPKHFLTKRIETKKIEVGPDQFSALQNYHNVFSTDLTEINPDLIFKIAGFANTFMFESVMRYYYKQDMPQISRIIDDCTHIPFPVAQIISDYCPYVLTPKVRNVVTLTYQNKPSMALNTLTVDTPFLSAWRKLNGLILANNTNPNYIKPYIEFLEFLLECGEDSHRIPWDPSHLPPSFLEDLKIKDTNTLVNEISQINLTTRSEITI